MPYKKQLLNSLLDRYERSQGFVKDRSQRRRIQLRLYDAGGSDFAAYDIEDSQARSRINDIVLDLEAQGVITFKWMKGQEGHLIARVYLVPEALPQAYRLAGRRPLMPQIERLGVAFRQQLDGAQHDWAKAYWQEQLDFLQRHRRLPQTFPAQEPEQGEWFAVLSAADRLDGETMLERVFSQRYLGDSKRFEQQHRSRLRGVLKHYLPLDTDELTEEELFQQIGLEKYPEVFSLCGDVTLQKADGAQLPLGGFAYGAMLDSREAAGTAFQLGDDIRRILWIENKANYYDYLAREKRPDEVLVFHGGFYSPARGQFFQALCRAAGPQVQLLHWGDIDLGGFQMHARLRREVDARFACFRMGVAELEHCASQTRSLPSADYRTKLQALLAVGELANAHSCIRYMLEQNVRLEQEALL